MSTAAEPVTPSPPSRFSYLRIGLGAALALIVGLSGMLWIFSSLEEDLLARDRERRMSAISQTLTISLDRASRFALAEAQTISSDASVAKALGAQDRKQLQDLMSGLYQTLKTHGVGVVGFQTPDLKYFLRLHQPDNFGDDQSKTRPILLAANKSRQPQSGVESGMSGAFARGATIVTDAGQFVGTVEVGINLDGVIEDVKTATNADVAVLLSKTMTGQSDSSSHETFGDLLLVGSTDAKLFGLLLRDDAIELKRDLHLSNRQIGGLDSAILTQPLIDFSGRMIGVVAAVKSFSQHNIERRQTRVDMFAAAIIAGIFAFAVFSVLSSLALKRARASA